jgi:acetyl-CoA synthetase
MVTRKATAAHEEFKTARDLLLRYREDYDVARRVFRWPDLRRFNWAIDWFDVIAENNDTIALLILEEDGRELRLSFEELASRSNRLSNYLRSVGVVRGSRVLLMLPNIAALWESMLACMKLGAVIIPSTPMLTAADALERVARAQAQYVLTTFDQCGKFLDMPTWVTGVVVGGSREGWRAYELAFELSP